MTIGFLFWLLMVLWFVFGLYWNRGAIQSTGIGAVGGDLLLFILLFLIGWRLFGFVIQG